ncbi:right-handed parallel beta-helix repeat-containing protein [candidate division CSSED10-310 bacterium]|uniref:Right-handed parallel beta-helix repeat-containing protein n=1 Tax=candidate division CSSED10-310 bacterium TaxID=2855610 RepID=A0ABV6YZM0_UNCC1
MNICRFLTVFLFLLLLLPNSTSADIIHSGTITIDDIWYVADGVHVVMDNTTIDNGVTVTVEAGAIIKIEVTSSITGRFLIDGALVANGTITEPITITSYRDDSIGGDTNGDGDATFPAREDWRHLQFNPPSDDTTCLLNYCNIRYGGANWGSSSIYGAVSCESASPTITNCNFYMTYWPIRLDLYSHPTILNNSFTNNTINGIVLSDFDATELLINAHWPYSDAVYVLMKPFTVTQDIVWTIDPGVIIKVSFGGYDNLEIKGALGAIGTDSDKIVFTSLKDDSSGGDTNNDQNATTASPGDWKFIEFLPTCNDSLCRLEHCIIKYGGGGYFADGAIECNNASPTFKNVLFLQNTTAIYSLNTSNFVVDTCDFQLNSGKAVSIDINTSPTVVNSSFNSNGWNCFYIRSGTMTRDVTLSGSDMVYCVAEAPLIVDTGYTLTVEEGAIFKMNFGGYEHFDVAGTLDAQGTVSNPIVFTSLKDDTIGGDTNNDGSATSPASGDYKGFRFLSGSQGAWDYCEVHYGGHGSYSNGIVQITASTPTFTRCTFSYNYKGIYIDGSCDPFFDRCEFISNGRYQTSSHVPTVSSEFNSWPEFNDCQFNDNAFNCVTIRGGTLSRDIEMPKLNVPYCVGSDTLVIDANSTLLMPAGTVIKFGFGSYENFDIFGELRAIGSSTIPVIFTSMNDDTAGGDTNNDGSSTTPSPGASKGLRFNPDSTGTLQFCEFRYGWQDHFIEGVIQINSSDLLIEDCLFYKNKKALYINGSADTVVNHCVFTDTEDSAAIRVINSFTSVFNSLFINNPTGIDITSDSGATVENCTFDLNEEGIYCDSSPTSIIRDSIIFGSSQYGMHSEGACPQIHHNCMWNPAAIGDYLNCSGTSGDIFSDPLFINGPDGDYYLSHIAAGQSTDSPAINMGDETALAMELNAFTTRTDQVADTEMVDMGFHYPMVNYWEEAFNSCTIPTSDWSAPSEMQLPDISYDPLYYYSPPCSVEFNDTSKGMRKHFSSATGVISFYFRDTMLSTKNFFIKIGNEYDEIIVWGVHRGISFSNYVVGTDYNDPTGNVAVTNQLRETGYQLVRLNINSDNVTINVGDLPSLNLGPACRHFTYIEFSSPATYGVGLLPKDTFLLGQADYYIDDIFVEIIPTDPPVPELSRVGILICIILITGAMFVSTIKRRYVGTHRDQ